MGGLSRNGYSPLQTCILYHLKDRRQISCQFEVNLFASEAHLKQTEKCKSNDFIKKDQKITWLEGDSKWIWNEHDTNLKQIWKKNVA